MQPNILLITSDQQHWNTIGKHFDEIHTPNLDRLADRGTLFHRAYCPNPTCTPTRASILTGQYPSQHGAWTLGTKLPDEAETVAERLSNAGYQTSLVGKAHFQQLIDHEEYKSLESYPIMRDLDFWRDFNGPFYGFDHVELARNHGDEAHVGQHYALWMEEKGFTEWPRHFQNHWGDHKFGEPKNEPQKHRWTLPEEYHMNAWITERSAAQMDQAKAAGKPFFVWASYFDPHPPYLIPEPWDTMYDPEKLTVPQIHPDELAKLPPHIQATQTPHPDFSEYLETPQGNHGLSSHLQDRESLAKDIAVYYGMISMMDKYIGKLLDHLEAIGEADNTLIVFTTDHGHFYGHHGLNAKGPFHFEDVVRVPFIVSWPGHVPQGAESDALQSLVDLPVSFLHAAGCKVPNMMQGVDQLPVWEGQKASARDHVRVEFRHQPTAIHLRTFIDERYKLTVYYNREYGELFDLQEDPGEINNLWDDAASQPLRESLTRKLLFAEMGDEPLWMPRIAPA